MDDLRLKKFLLLDPSVWFHELQRMHLQATQAQEAGSVQYQSESEPEQLKAFKYFQYFAIGDTICLCFLSFMCLYIVRKHQPFLVCYQIIGLVILSSIFFLLNQVFIVYFDQNSQNALISETICCAFVNLQILINVLFVRKQWLTTRKIRYRQSIYDS